MSKLYLFSIGGSGSRVLKQFVMMLASGVDLGSIDEVIPVLIDYDVANARGTYDMLQNYSGIQNDIWGESKQHSFFGIKMSPKTPFSINDNQMLPFSQYISPLSPTNDIWSRILFSSNNLATDMDQGFKGQPHIGSVVFANLYDEGFLADVFTNYQNGDKVFIISSIFGGTGAAGLPALVKKLRQKGSEEGKEGINRAGRGSIGGISLQPYFGIDHNSDGAEKDCPIKSETFLSRTQVATEYYKRELIRDINSLYILGDRETLEGKNYLASTGNVSQEENDPPHVIECLASAAIIDFVKVERKGAVYMGYREGSPLNFDSFGTVFDGTKNPMAAFYLFSCFMKNCYEKSFEGQGWAEICSLVKDGRNLFGTKSDDTSMAAKIFEFCEKYFFIFDSMAKNNKSFKPFNLESYENAQCDCMRVLFNKTGNEYTSLFQRKKSYDYLIAKLNEFAKSDDFQKHIEKGVYKNKNIMVLFSSVFNGIIKKLYN